MIKLNMDATGGTIIAKAEENNSSIFKKLRVLGSMEFSHGATNEHDQVDSIGGSSNTISSREVVIVEMFNTQCKEEADDAVVEFFFANGISFNATRSPLYKEIIRKFVVFGPSFQPPGYNKMKTTLLNRGI
jgi:hypothetical protein